MFRKVLTPKSIKRLNRLTDEWTVIKFADRATTLALIYRGLAERCPETGSVRITDLGRRIRNETFGV